MSRSFDGRCQPGANRHRFAVVQLVAATAEEIYGRKPVIAPNMPGTGPWYDFGVTLESQSRRAGSITPSHKIHAPNENISIEDFLLGAKHAALIMERFGEDGASG